MPLSVGGRPTDLSYLQWLLGTVGQVDTKPLLTCHSLAAKLVIGGESRRMSRFSHLPRGVFLLQLPVVVKRHKRKTVEVSEGRR